MESSHTLILNEDAFKQIPDHKKPVYVFEWLRYLDKGLLAAQKVRWQNGKYRPTYIFFFSNFDLNRRLSIKINSRM